MTLIIRLFSTVSEPITLCAFFFDTYLKDNQGDVTVSVVKVSELSEIED